MHHLLYTDCCLKIKSKIKLTMSKLIKTMGDIKKNHFEKYPSGHKKKILLDASVLYISMQV